MVAMETDHPGYGFAVHKGYGALSAALNELGPCAEHRHSFINVRRVASGSGTRVVAECQPDDDAGRPEPREAGDLAEPDDDAGRPRSEEAGNFAEPCDHAGRHRARGGGTPPRRDAAGGTPARLRGRARPFSPAGRRFGSTGSTREKQVGKDGAGLSIADGEGRLSR